MEKYQYDTIHYVFALMKMSILMWSAGVIRSSLRSCKCPHGRPSVCMHAMIIRAPLLTKMLYKALMCHDHCYV